MQLPHSPNPRFLYQDQSWYPIIVVLALHTASLKRQHFTMRQPLFLSGRLRCVGCDIDVMSFLPESKQALRMMLDAKLVVAKHLICKQENCNRPNHSVPTLRPLHRSADVLLMQRRSDRPTGRPVNLMCSSGNVICVFHFHTPL